MIGEDYAGCFVAANSGSEDEVLLAVRLFARTGRWPLHIDPLAAAMIRLRLETASQLATNLDYLQTRLQMSSRVKWKKAQWIHWFLIEAWDHVNFGAMHSSFEELRPWPKRSGNNPDKPPLNSDTAGHQSGSM